MNNHVSEVSRVHSVFRLGAGVAVFLGAALMFQLELLIGKLLLREFGSASSVWVTCLVFFQFSLLAGYAYAHAVARLPPRGQSAVHAFLTVLTLAIVGWKVAWPPHTLLPATPLPPGELVRHPARELIRVLVLHIGAPFVLLATTSSLVQAWHARVTGDGGDASTRVTYRLYALSNAGSLLGLLAYPFLVEVFLPLHVQQVAWFVGFLVYGVCMVVLVVVAAAAKAVAIGGEGSRASTPRAGARGHVAARASAWSPNPSPGSGPSPAPPAGVRDLAVRRAGCDVAAPPPVGEVSPPPGADATAWHSALRTPHTAFAWLLLSACGSGLLVSVTNQLCQDVSPMPLLWVLPLAVYLLTFILAFGGHRAVNRLPPLPLAAAGVALAWVTLHYQMRLRLLPQVGGHTLALFLTALACHTALYRARPPTSDLTRFYLFVAVGGAVGGLLAGVAAPGLLNGLWEYPIALVVCVLLATWCESSPWPGPCVAAAARPWIGTGRSVETPPAGREPPLGQRPSRGAGGHMRADGRGGRHSGVGPAIWLIPAIAALLFWQHGRDVLEGTVLSVRGFYGALHVSEQVKGAAPNQVKVFSLMSGRITHGMQPDRSSYHFKPTVYYWDGSGLGMSIARWRAIRPETSIRIGGIGMGIGTLCAYGKPGDRIRFYEINPDVIRIAHDERFFTYLSDCRARVDIVEGDARLTMTDELTRGEAQRYDILVLDAFSGDAIPSHLLTREAFDVYLQHLAPDGVIAWHATNRHVDFAPLGLAIARDHGLSAAVVDTPGDMRISAAATWILMARDASLLDSPEIRRATVPPDSIGKVRAWTDDFNPIYALLKIGQPERPGLSRAP